MSANRTVPPAPSVGDAIRNLGGEAPPEDALAPEEFAPGGFDLVSEPVSPLVPVPLAEVESFTGTRTGGWDSAGDDVGPRSAPELDEVATETVFVPVLPPEPVSPSSHIAFAPASSTPDAASHRVGDSRESDPNPYMPSTGASRVPSQSVAAGLAAMGLETPVEPGREGDFDFPAAAPLAPTPLAAMPVTPAFENEPAEPVFADEPLAPPPFESFDPEPVRTPAPAPVLPPPAAATVLPVSPLPVPPAPLPPVAAAPAPAAPLPPGRIGPVSAPPAYARPENIEPEYLEEPGAPQLTEIDVIVPVAPESEHVMPPLGPAGVYSPAPPVASVLPGMKTPAFAPPGVSAPPAVEYPAAPEPEVPDTDVYEYAPEVYEAEDPRDALRSATRRAVDRLTRPVPTPAELEPVQVHDHNLPRIVELTMQVERAVIGAAAAERFQREIEQTAREAAADVISTAATDAQRALESATAESHSVIAAAQAEAEKVLSDSLAESGKILSDAHTERDAIIARSESQATATVAQAEIELSRRLRRIAALTDEIVEIAESAVERTGAGKMSGAQIAQFIGALSTVTERALEHIEQANQTSSIPTPHATDEHDVGGEDEIES